jgi:hypothetical protein
VKKFSKIVCLSLITLFFSTFNVTVIPALDAAHAETTLGDVSVTFDSSSEQIQIHWSGNEDGELTIENLDGSLEYTTTRAEGEIISNEVQAGFRESFRVELVREVVPEDYKKISSDLLPKVVKNPESLEAITVQELFVPVPDGLGTVTQTTANAAPQPTATTFKYVTFIAADRVWDPMVWGCPSGLPWSYFVGDNRDFDSSSENFRTRVFVRVDWQNGGAVSSSRSAGTSRLVHIPGIFEETAVADVSKISVRQTSASNTQSKFHVSHFAVDPLCWIAVLGDMGIEYEYDVTVQKSGGYGVSGYAKRIPHHEAYIRDSNSPSWKTVLRREGPNFACLAAYLDVVNDSCNTNASYSGQVY